MARKMAVPSCSQCLLLHLCFKCESLGGCPRWERRGGGDQDRGTTFICIFFLNFEFAKGSSLAASCGDWGVRFARAFGAKVMCPWDGEGFSDFFPALGIFIFFPFSS